MKVKSESIQYKSNILNTATIIFFLIITPKNIKSISINSQYNNARNIRTIQGHEAGVPYYKKILQDTNDNTASARIASGIHSLERQDQTCCFDQNQDVRVLRDLLVQNGYSSKNINQLFAVDDYATAPLYVKPILPNGNNRNSPDVTGSPLKCLVSLFLLGYASK